MEEITVIPSSRDTADCGPIILRQTESIRLVFHPQLVNSARDDSQSVKGHLIYQRKKKEDEWEDIGDIKLSHLKAGEGVQLELGSDEVQQLVRGIEFWYEFHKVQRVPRWRTVVTVERPLVLGGVPTTTEVPELGEALKKISTDDLADVLTWAASSDKPREIVRHLERLSVDTLREINTLVGLATLKNALAHWSANEGNANEEDWQKWLEKNSFVFSQLFSIPVVVVKGKAYVGGKGVEYTGGNVVDYLCKNELTMNAALVEIKTPVSPLLAEKYRGDVYNLAKELTGAVQQVTNSKHTFQMEFPTLAINSRQKLEGFSPPCFVIAGNTSEFAGDRERIQSFELYRNGLKDVVVITFDEMFRKVRILVELLEKGT